MNKTFPKTNKFYKYQAIGNDYIVIDPSTFDTPLDSHLIKTICDRNLGIGADGILFGPFTTNGSLSLRIFNPDGSEAEKSGNGIRIFSRYLYDMGYIEEDHFRLETNGGLVYVSRLDKHATDIVVDMGKPVFEAQNIPVIGCKGKVFDKLLRINSKDEYINCVSMGNPHCVIFRDTISKELACRLGPHIESHPLFPQKTNVQFAKIIDKHTVQMEIWERGAGYTLGSGSSSCAVVSVAIEKGLLLSPATVIMPGGKLIISISENGNILMKGPVRSIAYGYINSDLINLKS